MALLLKSQRAELFQILQQNGFNPGEFEFSDYVNDDPDTTGSQEGEILGLRGTDYYFGFYTNSDPDSDDLFELEFSPGSERAWERRWCADWLDAEYEFTAYLQQLRREMETVDPWSDIQTFFAAVELLRPEPMKEVEEVSVPIPEPQRQKILHALAKVEKTLFEHVRDSKEQQAFVRQQFVILEGASTKFNRKDYLMLAYNVITGMATTLGLSSQFWAGLLKPLTDVIGFFGRLLR